MKQPGTPPFASMSGLPSRHDAELQDFMDVTGRLPRASAETLIRHFYRAALGYERTGNTDYLTCLADDALVTIRLRGDPEYEKAVGEAPDTPGDPADAVDVEELLARHGL